MESFLIAIAPELITLAGTILIALAGWGIALLRTKVKTEAGKKALDIIDSIIRAVVGNLAQTSAKDMRVASKDGHLSKVEKQRLKIQAFHNAKLLISNKVEKAARNAITNLDVYVNKKIEDQVLDLKGGDKVAMS